MSLLRYCAVRSSTGVIDPALRRRKASYPLIVIQKFDYQLTQVMCARILCS